MVMGNLNLPEFSFTNSMAWNRYLAIRTVMKGSISLSSKMVCRYLCFLVSAVGLTRELTMKSDRWSPRCSMNCFLIQLKCMFFASPSSGLVMMHPLTLSSGLSSSSLITTSPPILCPYTNRGKSFRACFMMAMTSFSSSLTSTQPRAPPEYPNPRRSTSSTSNRLRAQQSAMDLKRVECSPNPCTMQMVQRGSMGVKRVWYNLICSASASMQVFSTVQCSLLKVPRNYYSESMMDYQLIISGKYLSTIILVFIIRLSAYYNSMCWTEKSSLRPKHSVPLKRTNFGSLDKNKQIS